MPVIQQQRRNAIPILYTSGTYYEVGFDVGRTFRGIIQDFVSSYKELNEVFLPAYETREGRAAYDATMVNLQTNFPQYVRELQGTADGARIPFHHLMLMHMENMIPKNSPLKNAKDPSGQKSQGTFGCSSICCNHDGQVFLGHTEDALPEVLNHIYIVSAHIHEDTPQGKWKVKSEGFTALCYAGHLPGFCMGYNHHGLVFSINVIFPTVVVAGKTPRMFITRALLAAQTMEVAQKVLRDRGVGSSDGFSVNMSFTMQAGDHLFHNAEVGPAVNCDESPLSVLTISPKEHFVHTNKYLRLNIPEDIEIEGKSSTCRLARAECSAAPENKDNIIALLSNTDDKEYPFFRSGVEPDAIYTVTVGLFDILEKTWTLWMRNPTTCDAIVTMPLIFKYPIEENN